MQFANAARAPLTPGPAQRQQVALLCPDARGGAEGAVLKKPAKRHGANDETSASRPSPTLHNAPSRGTGGVIPVC